ncbi:PorT family protein [bacterium]|nr:PorT family protein [bacterium]
MTVVFLSQGYAQTWSIAAETQTVFAYRALLLGGMGNQNARNVKQFRNNLEQFGIRQGFGISILKELNPKQELSIGVNYTNQAVRADYSTRFEDQIDPTKGFVNTTQEPIEGKFFTSFKYIELPLNFYFKINNDKSFYRIGGGLVPKYLFNASATNFFASNVELNHFESFNLGVAGSFGYYYKLRDQFTIGMNLIGQYDVVPIKDERTREYLYSFRLGLGCIYKLNSD